MFIQTVIYFKGAESQICWKVFFFSLISSCVRRLVTLVNYCAKRIHMQTRLRCHCIQYWMRMCVSTNRFLCQLISSSLEISLIWLVNSNQNIKCFEWMRRKFNAVNTCSVTWKTNFTFAHHRLNYTCSLNNPTIWVGLRVVFAIFPYF